MFPLLARVDLRVMAMKEAPHFPKLQHNWNLTIKVFSNISWKLIESGGLTPLQKFSRCILQPQPNGKVGDCKAKFIFEQFPKIIT